MKMRLSERINRKLAPPRSPYPSDIYHFLECIKPEVAQLETQLQDANRKLAALGHCPTEKIMNKCNQCFYKRIVREDEGWCYMFREFMENCAQYRVHSIRSLCQQEWDDYEAERDKNFRETRKDAYNSGNP